MPESCKRLEPWIFGVMIALNVAAFWVFRYFPSQDGPNHVYNAQILHYFNHPDYAAFKDYFEVRKNPSPYWFCYVVLDLLMYVASPLIAEKLLLTFYVVLFALGFRYLLRVLRPGNDFLAFLCFPLLPNYCFQMGYYNYCFGLALLFWVFAYWLKYLDAWRIRHVALLSTITLLLYFSHFSSLVTVWVWMAIWLLWKPRRLLWARLAFTVSAAIPAALLAGWFIVKNHGLDHGDNPWMPMLRDLTRFEILASYSRLHFALARVVFGGFVLMAIGVLAIKIRRWQFSALDGLLLLAPMAVLAYLNAPQISMGAADIHMRMSIYPILALVPWLGVQAYSTPWRVGVIAGSCIASLLFLATIVPFYKVLNDRLREYTAVGSVMERGKTLLPVHFTNLYDLPDRWRVAPHVGTFTHAADYLAIDKGLIDLTNMSSRFEHCPIRFREAVDPIRYLETSYYSLEFSPPEVDLKNYTQNTGRLVDYALLFARLPRQTTQPQVQSLDAQLHTDFTQVYPASGTADVTLLRRNSPH